ncbi:MAG: zf-HC2 domain-containing protein [Sphingomonadales bacterium]|nr:zf-HC2 domain-containing protein [Sphingomonadales bacterium]MDE2569300.1 zf-HC2 domain-containing protein [Sphingomonadales bacterium]
MTVTREQIAAYADGELSGEELARVEAAIAADPALERQVASHRLLKATLGAHFAPILDAPVPDRLVEAVRGGAAETNGGAEVVDFAAARDRREERKPRSLPRWTWAAVPALAASLALAVVLTRPGAPGPGYADAQLAAALDNQLVATQPANAPTRVLLSFADKRGELCRTFAGADKSGIACRDDRGWRIARTLGGGAAEMGEYRQAGSPDAALMAAAQDMAAGPALDAAQEQAAKTKGWRQ